MRKASMQKRHFELIANTIRELPDLATRQIVAEHFARNIAHTNGQFKRERFIEWCTTREVRPAKASRVRKVGAV